MTNILAATTGVIVPYADGKLKIVVSSVTIDNNGVAKVAWSDTKNGTARAVGSTVTLPAALNVANTSLIWAESQYAYTPTDRLCHHRHDESERSDLYAAAPIGHGCAHAVILLRRTIGSAVVCLIRSIAKREVTFFSGIAAISRL